MFSDLKLLSSATTVWSLSSSFFQTTVSPTLIDSEAGEYLLFLIVIVWVLAVRLVAGDFSADFPSSFPLAFWSSAPKATVQRTRAKPSMSRNVARRDVINRPLTSKRIPLDLLYRHARA